MTGNAKTRLGKLEKTLLPQRLPWRGLLNYGKQKDIDGEIVLDEPHEAVIARHLREHPEDEGLEFYMIVFVGVTP